MDIDYAIHHAVTRESAPDGYGDRYEYGPVYVLSQVLVYEGAQTEPTIAQVKASMDASTKAAARLHQHRIERVYGFKR